MVQLMPLPLTASCFSKIQIGFTFLVPAVASVKKSRLVLPFWYWLTRVVPDKVPLNGCVCVCEYLVSLFIVLEDLCFAAVTVPFFIFFTIFISS